MTTPIIPDAVRAAAVAHNGITYVAYVNLTMLGDAAAKFTSPTVAEAIERLSAHDAACKVGEWEKSPYHANGEPIGDKAAMTRTAVDAYVLAREYLRILADPPAGGEGGEVIDGECPTHKWMGRVQGSSGACPHCQPLPVAAGGTVGVGDEPLQRGDEVVAVPPFALACGSGIYRSAIVVSTNPFALASEEGDMLWVATVTPEKVRKIGVATYTKPAFKRWRQDSKNYPPACRSPGADGGANTNEGE